MIYLEKADYDTKIDEIEKKILDNNHGKHIAIQDFNKLWANEGKI